MSRIDIGFIEEDFESWKLESRFFPSKIGGRPAWLDLKRIPTKKEVECDFCGNPCIFLCQVYAPYEEDAKAFHRTIYVFICRSTECCKTNESGNLKVLRSQLERTNEFYPSDPPDERKDWRVDINTEKWIKTCRVCGVFASSHCSKCKRANYCCREHQIVDWKNGHKGVCNTDLSAESSSILFPEFELTIETEDDSEQDYENDDFRKESREIKRYETLVDSGRAGTFQDEEDVDSDLLKMANNTEDETFTEFCERIKKYPDQVLRYDRGGTAMYIASTNQPKDIPSCQECGGERQFEFQIMPQLLNYFTFEDVFKSLDWGILAIFTCKQSCVPKSGYVAEYVWKQDIVEDDASNISQNKDAE